MKIFKKIEKWLLSSFQDELNKVEARADYWREEFEKARELVKQQQGEIFQLKKKLQEKEKQISELKDEINTQKCKTAKYLSCYLEEMEKRAPNN